MTVVEILSHQAGAEVKQMKLILKVKEISYQPNLRAVVISSSLENLRKTFNAALRGGKGGSIQVQATINLRKSYDLTFAKQIT